MKLIFINLFLLLSLVGHTQKLLLEEFLLLVKNYHPVVKQAALGVEMANVNITSARAGFDPQFNNSISRKDFGGLLYYDHQLSEINIPTWYGADITVGIESLSGERTSSPDTKGNTSYLGISLPVTKELLMDERRATLQQAKIFQKLSVQEQRNTVNDLLFEAAKSYWQWWEQHQAQRIFQQAIDNIEQRFRLVKTSFEIGERPAIDTVEALAQLQTFQQRANEIMLDVMNSQLELSVFLWKENNEPYALPQGVLPQTEVLPVLETMQIDALLQKIGSHPEMQQYRFKLEALEVEKRLKFQSLLPSVYVKYNQLTTSHNLHKTLEAPLLQNNYRYRVAVSIPLRFSQGRGEYSKTKLKIEQTRLQQLTKQVSLQTKLRQYYNEWKQLREQIALQQRMIQSYATLQRGEETKFTNGESSLFLVNTRELKTLEAQQKLVELQSKEQKIAAAALWVAGTMAE